MKSKILAIDTTIFIYHFEANRQYISFTTAIFNSFIENKFKGITSVISVIETLSYPAPDKLIKEREEDFKTLPHFNVYDVTQEIAIITAKIRRKYKYRTPDAIQLATALYGKADIFITNDTKLQQFKELKVMLLKEFTKFGSEVEI
ncbi:MAG: type II toxin-antitoxin system VapC family toxin [Candidatus Levyibacteriota bacterium]